MIQDFIEVSPWWNNNITLKSKKEINYYHLIFDEWKGKRNLFLHSLNKVFPTKLVEKLDFSIDSLIQLEKYLIENFSKEDLIDGKHIIQFDFANRYIGEVFINAIPNAHWEIELKNKRNFGFFKPYIDGITIPIEPLNDIYAALIHKTGDLLFNRIKLKIQNNFEEINLININHNHEFNSYSNLILIANRSSFNLKTYIEKVKRTLSLKEAVIEVDGENVYVKIKNWVVKLSMNESSSVLEESQEMAEMIKDEEKRRKIATCSKRIEMIATEDPNIDYFNYHLYILEAAQEFTDVFVFNPYSGFM